jgi:hypothetical protein
VAVTFVYSMFVLEVPYCIFKIGSCTDAPVEMRIPFGQTGPYADLIRIRISIPSYVI